MVTELDKRIYVKATVYKMLMQNKLDTDAKSINDVIFKLLEGLKDYQNEKQSNTEEKI